MILVYVRKNRKQSVYLKEANMKVVQSCLTLRPHGLCIHGILQARIPEWVAFSRASSQPRVQSQVSRITGRFFTNPAKACVA